MKIKKMRTKIPGLGDKDQISGKLATLLTRTQEEFHIEDLLLCADDL